MITTHLIFFFFNAGGGGGGPVTSGLVLHLDSDNPASYPGSGTAWNDLSGTGNHGTFTATPSVSGGVINLNGSYHVTTTNQFTNPQAFSLEVWFRTNSALGRKLIGFENFQTGTPTQYDRHYYVDTSGNLIFGVFLGGQNIFNYGPVNDNSWRAAVVTYDGGSNTHYINGAPVGTRTALAFNFSGWWRVFGFRTGGWPGGTTVGGFVGDGAIVRVYNRALTAAEVLQNYDANRSRFGLGPAVFGADWFTRMRRRRRRR